MIRKTKKLIAVVFALLMVLAVAIPALAAESGSDEVVLTEDTTGSIIMSDATDGDTFQAFAVMTYEYDATNNTVEYVPSTAFAAFLTGEGMTFTEYQELTDDTAVKNLLGAFSAYCKTSGAPVAFPLTANTLKENVPLGQYVINGTASTTDQNVFQVMTASFPVTVKPDPANDNKATYFVNSKVTITVKKDKPTLDKSIPSEDVQYAIGDYVDYSIVTTVPTYPPSAIRKAYIIGDHCDATLTHIYDDTEHPFMVKARTTEAGAFDTTLTLGNHYTMDTKTGTDFVLNFDYDKIADYQAIQVLYYAKVNQSAVVTDPLNNTANLTYSVDPYNHESTDDETITDEEEVYTYGLEVTKVDAADTTKALPGAEFMMYKKENTALDDPILFVLQEDGTYKVAESATGAVSTLATDANGKINITGLDVGEYVLKETKVPAGYTLPEENFSVTIADTEKDGTAVGEGITENSTTPIVPLTITNGKVTTVLPQTGGAGTVLFIVIGICIMVAAVVAFAVIRKKAKGDK